MDEEMDKKLVFAVTPAGDDGVLTVIIGVPRAAWEAMSDSTAHNFDLGHVGLPLRCIVFGAEDHASAMAHIEGAVASRNRGETIVDARRRDMSIRHVERWAAVAEALLDENIKGMPEGQRGLLVGLVAGALSETHKMGLEQGRRESKVGG